MIYNDQKLPPLKSLAAFLACAQKQSFTEAAKVLHVTHSAISQNIRNLEEFFGASLFIRGPKRQTKLTEKGERYFREIERAFSILFNATQRELSETTDNILTVNLLTTLAFNWLIPRLPEFQAIHPECDLRVSTRGITVDFVHDAIDINITYGTTSQREGLYSHFLFPDQLILVANQDLFHDTKHQKKLLKVPMLSWLTHNFENAIGSNGAKEQAPHYLAKNNDSIFRTRHKRYKLLIVA